MQLIPYLEENFGLSDELLREINQQSNTKHYARKEVVLATDQHSKHVYFVESGLLRLFYHKSGKDITHFFFPEQHFLATSESLFYNKSSIYGIEAVEKSTVTIVPYALIEKFAVDSIPVNKLIQSILLQSLIAFSSRLQSLQFETAQERYQKLISENPDILLRAPLGDIASYLGISQQTLSVIRAQR